MTHKRRRPKPVETPKGTVADYFKALFGWQPSNRAFRTTAKRECGGCRQIKPGDQFDVPVTPGRPDLNKCRGCL